MHIDFKIFTILSFLYPDTNECLPPNIYIPFKPRENSMEDSELTAH